MSKQTIGYIRQEAPRFEEPSYPGTRYPGLLPDTLDLQNRAALAINGITGPTDPDADYEIYFMTYFGRNKPSMSHDLSTDCQSKLQEALPLMRIVSGSDLNSQVDRCWMEVTLKGLGPDGLLYFPVKGRPWYGRVNGLDLSRSPSETEQQGRTPPIGYRSRARQLPKEIAHTGQLGLVVPNGRMLGVMGLYYLLTGDDLWKEAGERLVGGLGGLTQSPFWPGDTRSKDEHSAIATGWVLQGLSQFFQATGYEPALDLAGRCIEHIKKSTLVDEGTGLQEFFEERAPSTAGVRVPFGWHGKGGRHLHFHTTTNTLLGILEYAIATDNEGLIEQVRDGYEYAKLLGQPVVGFFPERVPNLWSDAMEDRADYRYETSETCEVADMISLGLKLTEAGVGDYWDEVDRWLRNQFAEAQLTDVEWVYRMTEELGETSHDPTYQTIDRVPERSLGAFAGWPSANDWYTGAPHYRGYYPHYPGNAIMQCCTGNAARAIYYAWEHILHYRDGNLRVNLLVNRSSQWADVNSYIPYEGQVDVKVKQPCELSVRIPEWASPETTICSVNDARQPLRWDGRNARVGKVQSGDLTSLSFPIPMRTDDVSIQGAYYKIVRKGSEVITIDPQGRYCPFYQRAHYRANSVRWRKATRFVADRTIGW